MRCLRRGEEKTVRKTIYAILKLKCKGEKKMKKKEIYLKWMDAWNTDLSILDDIVSENCVVHQKRTDGKSSYDLTGPEALKGIIIDGLALFDEAEMSIEVGPIEEDDYVSARWTFTGSFKGGMPGAKAEKGKEMSFHGMDIFLIKEGLIHEYWVSSDVLDLMVQMGVFEK